MYKTIQDCGEPLKSNTEFHVVALAHIDVMVADGKTNGERVVLPLDNGNSQISRTWTNESDAEEWIGWLLTNAPVPPADIIFVVDPVTGLTINPV
jgi:hypothetical protein